MVVCCGTFFTLTLDAGGNVWGFGCNKQCQMGDTEGEENVHIPRKISGLPQITSLSCGPNFSMFVDSNDCVWALGSNEGGNLGLVKHCLQASVPTIVNGLPPVYSVHCGDEMTYCITASREIWSFGENSCGQLGLGDYEARSSPCCVPSVTGVIQVAAGGSHCIILTDDGLCLSVGDNSLGQAGQGKKEKSNIFLKIEIDSAGEIINIATGKNHSLFLDSEGFVYGTGSSDDGELAMKGSLNVVKKLELHDIKLISCGYFHTICCDKNGDCFSFGYNYDGQLGVGNTRKQYSPVKLNVGNICLVSEGGFHTLIKDTDETIWCFGNNDCGQLGLDHSQNLHWPTRMDAEFSHIVKTPFGTRAKSARK